MCTISWMFEPHGYHVFFNRDEQNTRTKAQPPSILELQGVRALMPVDPDGEGSWLSTNEHGVTLALLNFYQGRLPKGRLKSRGQLVKTLAGAGSRPKIQLELNAINLQKFAPFSLLVFESCAGPQGVLLLRWTGKQLLSAYQRSPLISSAKLYEDVLDARLATYRQAIGENANVEDFYQLHRSHEPSASAKSVCMHRDDANTVSFSHVQVMERETCFHYFPGHPCEQNEAYTTRLTLRK